MKPLTQAVAVGLLIGCSAAHATFHAWEEGVDWPDFDDPSAISTFYLEDHSVYEYAAIFIGNVGRDGDPADHLSFSWSALKPGATVTSVLTWSTSSSEQFDSTQGLRINFFAQGSLVSILLDKQHPSYTVPIVFDSSIYRMSIMPAALAPADGIKYSLSIASPVPEPSALLLSAAGAVLLTFAARRAAQRLS